MEFFSHPVPAAIVLLGLLIFVHEFGHFIVGRLCGVGVEIFSIGFGPPIVRFNRGGTDYRLSWIPLGGYVKFYGMTANENVPAEMTGKEFYRAPLPARAMTMAAGPLANLVLAVVAYTVLGYSGIPHAQPIVGEIQHGSAAELAGLQFDDRIVAIDGKAIQTWQEMRDIISTSPEKTLQLKVEREGKFQLLKLTPDVANGMDFMGKEVKVGRAGIARGSLVPVVAVIDKSSPAAVAGIRSGEKVEAIKVAGTWRAVDSWQHFQRSLAEVVSSKDARLELRFLQTTAKGDTDKTQPAREVIVALQGLKLPPEPRSRNDLPQALGFRDAQLVIGEMDDDLGGPLKKGDVLVKWNGEVLKDIYQLGELQSKNRLSRARLEIVRDFKPLEVNLTLKPIEVQKPAGKDTLYIMPVAFLGQIIEPEPWLEKFDHPLAAVGYGFSETGKQTVMLVQTLGKLIGGEFPLKALGGPMMIAKVAGDSAKAGWKAFVSTMALISVNLAVINLFPIPVLDGGQLVICGLEAVRRRRLSEIAVENFQKIGFVMILALVVLATYNDLSRFWSSMLASVSGLFQ